MNKTIGVLGAGSWGTALAIQIARQFNVNLWGHSSEKMAQMDKLKVNSNYLPNHSLSEKIHFYSDLKEFLAKSDILVLVVPSEFLVDLLDQIKVLSNKQHIFINAAKGLEPEEAVFFSEIIDEKFDKPKQFVLSGPSFAIDVANNLPTAIVLSGDNTAHFDEVLPFFHHHNMRIYKNYDMKGVQIAGCYKNVIAIASGIANGLGLGKNAQAALITRGIAEMGRLGSEIGADLKTFLGLAGIGDLTLTATSINSRNYRFGTLLGENYTSADAFKEIKQVVEGAHNCTIIYELGQKKGIELPIVNELYAILNTEKTAKEALNDLLGRDPATEF